MLHRIIMLASCFFLIPLGCRDLVALAQTSPTPPFSGFPELFELHEARSPANLQVDEMDDETGYDVLHYNLEIRFDPADQSVNGRVDMLLTCTAASLAQVAMQLHYNMVVDCVLVDDIETTFDLTWLDNLTVDLPQTLSVGDTAEVILYYHGSPIGGSLGALFWDDHAGGIPIIASLSEPEGARTWWPCKDIPSDKATARMVWTVPDNLFATSNGLLQGSSDPEPGWKSFEWVENYPITTYLIAVTATNFAHFRNWYVTATGDSMPLDNYVYPEDSLNATVDFADLADVIAYFASVFGEYPFLEEKYGHAEFPWGVGAMEHQTLTSYGNGGITGDNTYHWMMVHELSHQWWGDLVTCETWMDIWLNEGFATYCDALWIDFDEGHPAFQDRMEAFRQAYFYWDSSVEGRFPIYDPDYMWGGTVYEKGAWILHMIRYVIGEENFWNFWLEYRDRFSFEAVTDAELQQTLEDVSGMDFQWFFDEWIYLAGYPEYEWGWNWETVSPESSQVDVSVVQVQDLIQQTPIFNMPIEMGVTTTNGYELHVVQNNQSEQNFSFLVSGIPLDVDFDPNIWILKTAQQVPFASAWPETSAEPVVCTLLELLQNPANPTAQIRLVLPIAQQATLTVYNSLGQRIAILAQGSQPAGETNFTWNGAAQASGMYLVRLETEKEVKIAKLVLMK